MKVVLRRGLQIATVVVVDDDVAIDFGDSGVAIDEF